MCDPDRYLYQAFGMPSTATAWDVRLQVWYAEKMRLGAKLSKLTHVLDTYQLGGNLVVDSEGVLRFVHLCEHPTDRPTVDQLLDVVKKCDLVKNCE